MANFRVDLWSASRNGDGFSSENYAEMLKTLDLPDMLQAINVNHQQFELFTRPDQENADRADREGKEEHSYSQRMLKECFQTEKMSRDEEIAEALQKRLSAQSALLKECSDTTVEDMLEKTTQQNEDLQRELMAMCDKIRDIRSQIDLIHQNLSCESSLSSHIKKNLKNKYSSLRKGKPLSDFEIEEQARVLCKKQELRKLSKQNQVLFEKKEKAEGSLQNLINKKFPARANEIQLLISDARKALMTNTKAEEYKNEVRNLLEKIKDVTDLGKKIVTSWDSSASYAAMDETLKPFMESFEAEENESSGAAIPLEISSKPASKRTADYDPHQKKLLDGAVRRLASMLKHLERGHPELLC